VSAAGTAGRSRGGSRWVYLWHWPIRAMHWLAAGSILVLIVTGFYIGIAMLGTPAGMVKHPDAISPHTRVVAGRLRWNDQLGDRPYTARLMYDDERNLEGPFSLTPQSRSGHEVLKADPPLMK